MRHGHNRRRKPSKEYTTWVGMKGRCQCPTNKRYPDYGGRGITMCERWQVFEKFLIDVGPAPSAQHSLDRIDNARGYEPGNVRWATRRQQANNKRRNRRVIFRGENLTITQWARRVGIEPSTLIHRFDAGWPTERAITEPVKMVPVVLSGWYRPRLRGKS